MIPSVFISDTKYTQWYYNIIRNAKKQPRIKGGEILFEKHHIIPKALGGNNDQDNLVLLTPREHFLAHWLLTKIVHLPKHRKSMYHALHRLTFGNNIHSSWQYEKARISQRNALKNIPRSQETKDKISNSQKGENNSFYGRKHSNNSKELISKRTKESITPERRHKNSQNNKGEKNFFFGRSIISERNLKWYTNGEKVIYVTENTQPEGYIRGRKLVSHKV